MFSKLELLQHQLKGLLQQSDQVFDLISKLRVTNIKESNELIDQLAQRLEKIALEIKELKQ